MRMYPLWLAWASAAATQEPFCMSPISLMALLSTLIRILTKFAYALPRVSMFIEVVQWSSTITHGTLYLTFRMDVGRPWSYTCDLICNKRTVIHLWDFIVCWVQHTMNWAYSCNSVHLESRIFQRLHKSQGGKLWLLHSLACSGFDDISDNSVPSK